MKSFIHISFLLVFWPSIGLGSVIGSDMTFSTLFPYENTFRTYNYLFLGTSTASVGAIGVYEQPHYYMTDSIIGPAVRIGDTTALEIGFGVFERSFHAKDQTGTMIEAKGSGVGGVINLTKHMGRFFRISLPMVIKKLNESEDDRLAKRITIEITPYIGVVLF